MRTRCTIAKSPCPKWSEVASSTFTPGAPLTPARWPNALLWTEEWWTREVGWAGQANGSFCGFSVDAGTTSGDINQTLAETGESFDGCNVIMNNEHWITRRYKVANHVAGTDTFTYEFDETNELCEKYGTYYDDNAYFIDGCVAAFDYPGEWVADAEGHLLVRLPTGSAGIDSVSMYGKVQTYAFAFSNCDRLTLQASPSSRPPCSPTTRQTSP